MAKLSDIRRHYLEADDTWKSAVQAKEGTDRDAQVKLDTAVRSRDDAIRSANQAFDQASAQVEQEKQLAAEEVTESKHDLDEANKAFANALHKTGAFYSTDTTGKFVAYVPDDSAQGWHSIDLVSDDTEVEDEADTGNGGDSGSGAGTGGETGEGGEGNAGGGGGSAGDGGDSGTGGSDPDLDLEEAGSAAEARSVRKPPSRFGGRR